MTKLSKIIQTKAELEVAVLKAAIDLLDEILANQLFDILGSGKDHNILFKTKYHQKYFYLTLIDFFSQIDKRFTINKDQYSLFAGLLEISRCPAVGEKKDVSILKSSMGSLNDWLNYKTKIEVWCPNIDKNAILELSRLDMLKICGNISKHIILRLGRIADNVKTIFEKSKISLSYDEAVLCLEDFYSRFHDDILNYHASYLVEMLFDIRRAINEYLKPIYAKSVVFTEKRDGIQMYKYTIPQEIKNKVTKKMFWDLMNDVRSNRSFPEIKVTRYLKMRY